MNKKSYAGRYFLFLLGKLRTCIILGIIFALCGFPMLAASYGLKTVAAQALLMCLAIISIAGSGILSFAVPLITMKHLYTKQSADNILSLPLTAFQRYICEAASALCACAVPLAAAIPVTAAVNAGSRYALPMSAALFLLTLLMFVSLNIFITGFCGRLAEAIIYPLLTNAALPLFFMLAAALSRTGLYGIENTYETNSIFFSAYYADLIAWTAPACFMIRFFNTFDLFAVQAFIGAAVYSAAFLALGYLVYKKRPVENIGQPFVYKRAFLITSLLIAFACMVSFIAFTVVYSAFSPVSCAVLAILLLILMLVMEFINYRKINGALKFLLKYAGVAAAGGLLSFLLYMSDGMGETWYIPAAADTEYISVTMEKRQNRAATLTLNVTGESGLAELLRAEHKHAIEYGIDYHKKNIPIPDGHDEFFITYMLKNGGIVSRCYFTVGLTDGILKKAAESEDYKYSDLVFTETRYFRNENQKIGLFSADEPDGISVRNPYIPEEYFCAAIDWTELKAALTEDLKNDTRFGRHDELPVCDIGIGELYTYSDGRETLNMLDNGYTIYESYVNTLAYIRRLGYVPTPQEALKEALDQDCLISLVRETSDGSENGLVTKNKWRINNETEQSAVFLSNEEVKEIMPHTADYVYADGQKYLYSLEIGIPDFLRDRGSGINDKYTDQLRRDGLLSSRYIIKYEYDDGFFYEGPGKYLLLNEKYYPELEKYFSMNDREIYLYSGTENAAAEAELSEEPAPAVTTAGEAHISS